MLKHSIVIGLIGLTVLVLLLLFAPEFSNFGAKLLYISLCVGIFGAIDKYVLYDIDTIEELKNGNIAYSLFLLAIAVLISASIIS